MPLEKSDENTNGFTFLWKIKNFRVYPTGGLESPTFRSEILGDATWQLRLYPGFCGGVKLYLCRLEKEPLRDFKGYIELFIIKTNGFQVKVQERVNNFKSGDISRCLMQSRTEILDEKNSFLSDETLTVGCFIKREPEKRFESVKCTAYSDISAEKFIVAFPLFFSLGMPLSVVIPLISVTEKYPDFKIVLNSCDYFKSGESLSIQIKMAKSSFKVFTVCKLSLQDEEGKAMYLVEGRRWFKRDSDDETWELENSIPEPHASYPRSTSNFTLHCNFVVTDGTYTSNIESVVCPSSSVELNEKNFSDCSRLYSLKEKVKNLYTNKTLCDFTIHVDGKEFPVHKTVLGSVSPVFCAMFERDMKEKHSSLLYIEDIDADTVQRLIDFAYNENVEDLQWDSAAKLFSAADKYEILELKQYCVNFMIPKIAIENVLEVLMISDLHLDKNLEKAAKDFIFVNSRQFFSSDGWKVFMENNMKLANKIMYENLNKN